MKPSIESFYAYQEIASEGSDNYYALLTLPKEKRPRIAAIYHLFHLIINIPFTNKEEAIGKTKLHWWQQELQKTTQQEATHPTTRFCQKQKIDVRPLQKTVEAVLQLFDYCQFEALEDYMHMILQTFGQQENMIAKTLGFDIKKEATTISEYAFIQGLTYFTKTLRQQIQKGFFIFVQSEMHQKQVDIPMLTNMKTTVEIINLLALQHQKIQQTPIAKLYHPSFLQTRLALQWWRAAESEQYAVLNKKIIIPPLRKLWQVAKYR